MASSRMASIPCSACPARRSTACSTRFHQAQLKVIGARHEQACGYMAFGYARSTGKPGVFSVVPGPGVLNAGRGAADRVRLQRAGAVPDRPGADRISRQGPRPSARDAGPARDAPHFRQMGRPHRISRRRTGDGVARVSGNAVGPPRPGLAGNAVGRVHPARGGRRRSQAVRSVPGAAARSRPHQGRRRADHGQQGADDLRRQRRDRRARRNSRTRRNDRRAGGGVPQRPRHRLQRP